MGVAITEAIEDVLHVAGIHKGMALLLLALLVLGILYNVMKRQYD